MKQKVTRQVRLQAVSKAVSGWQAKIPHRKSQEGREAEHTRTVMISNREQLSAQAGLPATAQTARFRQHPVKGKQPPPTYHGVREAWDGDLARGLPKRRFKVGRKQPRICCGTHQYDSQARVAACDKDEAVRRSAVSGRQDAMTSTTITRC